jgi:hypothetical protein
MSRHPRPNPICSVCRKAILPGAGRTRRGVRNYIQRGSCGRAVIPRRRLSSRLSILTTCVPFSRSWSAASLCASTSLSVQPRHRPQLHVSHQRSAMQVTVDRE